MLTTVPHVSLASAGPALYVTVHVLTTFSSTQTELTVQLAISTATPVSILTISALFAKQSSLILPISTTPLVSAVPASGLVPSNTIPRITEEQVLTCVCPAMSPASTAPAILHHALNASLASISIIVRALILVPTVILRIIILWVLGPAWNATPGVST